jgi:hypothetical protein
MREYERYRRAADSGEPCPVCADAKIDMCNCSIAEIGRALLAKDAAPSTQSAPGASIEVTIEAPPETQRSQREPAVGGLKKDAGKLPIELLPTRPIEAVARVLDFGAKKYAPNNWRKGLAFSRVYAAVIRHMWAWWRGEDNDRETGLPHLAHAACELFFLLDYTLRPAGPGLLDDRSSNDAG